MLNKIKKIILVISAFFILMFSGCATVKTQTIADIIPEIPAKPEIKHYELKLIKVNNRQFYALTPEDAKILVENWLSYKTWAEINYELLLKIKKRNDELNNKKNHK